MFQALCSLWCMPQAFFFPEKKAVLVCLNMSESRKQQNPPTHIANDTENPTHPHPTLPRYILYVLQMLVLSALAMDALSNACR